MDDIPTYRAGELLQTAGTISGIALALATWTSDRGPVTRGFHPLSLVFLFGGFLVLLGSLYAMLDLWDEVGMETGEIIYDVYQRPYRRIIVPHSLTLTMWGLLVTGLAYVMLLFASIP